MYQSSVESTDQALKYYNISNTIIFIIKTECHDYSRRKLMTISAISLAAGSLKGAQKKKKKKKMESERGHQSNLR